MKKLLALTLIMVMALSFAACSKNSEEPEITEPSQAQTTENQNTTASDDESIEGDPVEYGREYWEEKYPGENICPFYIDVNGTEYSYYWVSGFDGYDGTIESWLAQPFNWNGWHKTDDGAIVNEDETLKITDDWANGEESLSSFCTITTEKYEKTA